MTLKPLVASQPVYAGTWAASGASQVVKLRRTHDEFIAAYDAQWKAGYRLIVLTTHLIGGKALYSGVWNASSSGQFVGLARAYDQFIAEYGTWWKKGFRLAAFDTCQIDGTVYFSGVYNPSTADQFLGLGRTYDQFVSEYGTWWGKGFRLKALTSDVVGGRVLYNGVWNPGTSGQYLRLGRTHDDFLAEYSARWKEGYRLAALSSYVRSGVVHYDGAWNPSTAGQYLSLNHPQPDFLARYEERAAQGWRLTAIAGDHVEALDIGQMGEKISKALAGNCVGYAATVSAGSRVPVAGGLRRTAADSPSRPSSTSARVNVASVAKPITAVAVLQLLAAKRLSINTKILAYLPSDWTKGPNVNTITFRELLTHTSGIRNDQPETYANLKKLFAKGINLADKLKTCDGSASGDCYQNANYSLFRIIIPYLKGGYVAPSTNKATHVSAAYMAYMNQKVFGPAGISTVSLKPASTEPTLCYPFPAGSVKGIDFGDWTNQAGGAGYHLSSDDLAAFLAKLRDGTLLSAQSRNRMDKYMLGWRGNDPVRHGSVYSHGGGFPPQPGALNTIVMSFTAGVQVGVEVNSETKVDIRQRVVDAYNTSWLNVH